MAQRETSGGTPVCIDKNQYLVLAWSERVEGDLVCLGTAALVESAVMLGLVVLVMALIVDPADPAAQEAQESPMDNNKTAHTGLPRPLTAVEEPIDNGGP